MHDLKLYAKSIPPVTLLEHLLETLEIATVLSARNGNSDTDVVRASLIASAFHDIGKADERFQKYLFLNECDKKCKPPPHPLMSMPVADRIAAVLPEYHKSLALLAIVSHHSPLRSDLYRMQNPQTLCVQEREELYFIVDKICERLSIQKPDLTDIENVPPKRPYVLSRDYLSEIKDKQKLREDFVYIQGVLEQADWLASAGEDPQLMKFPSKMVRNNYDYQDVAAATEGNIFIMLPTGTGKTETALYWAKKNSENASRLFYVLPTTTTINAMFERLRTIFRDKVGEYHSNVDLFLDMEEDSVSDEELQMYKYFFMPFNVTTPDQLLLCLMNYKKFTLKSFSMQNSLMIFDEIHAYDAETFAMIKFLLNYLHRYYNVKFCVMSATFPNVLRKELGFLSAKELIPYENVIKQYNTRVRTKISFREDLIENYLQEISDSVKVGKKVLVVLNTVKRAQDIYKALKEQFQITDALLLHSRYTFADRRERELNLVNQCAILPSLLVSTQVIEVSLNISYDVMYTEACYVDSLVQRAGRINRFNKSKEPCEINVFLAKNHHPYQQNLLRKATELIAVEQKNIHSEWDYVLLTNKFYDEIWDSIRDDSDERFYSIWDSTRYVFSADLSDEETQELLRTRSGIVSVPAFPLCFMETIQEIQQKIKNAASMHEKMQLQRDKRRYLVNVPLIKGITFTDDSLGKFVNKAYDKEYGLSDDLDNMI